MAGGRVWFVTGASRGFGKIWAEAALRRGDRVAATARDPSFLGEMASQYAGQVLPLALDVTDHEAVGRAMACTLDHFGRVDIVISNAGYGLMGAIEEVAISEARANFETNVMGTLSVIQAAVAPMRRQGSGHILAVSSVGGLVTFPMGGVYQATKFAVEGLLQTLAQEVAAFGIKVTLIEPGPFKTEFMNSGSLKHAVPIDAYDPMRDHLSKALGPEMFADPADTVDTVLRVVDAQNPPLHVMLGSLLPMVKDVYAARMQCWEEWASKPGS